MQQILIIILNLMLWGETSKATQMMIKTPNCPTRNMDSFESSKSLPKDFCKVPCIQNESATHKGGCGSTVLFEIGETGLENEPFGRARSCSLDSCSPLKANSGNFTTSKSDSDPENFAIKGMPFSQVSSPPNFIGGSHNSNTFPPTESESNTVSICSSNDFFNSLSASEIELSEDYTCVICHGPNPKTTHIFGDSILGSHSDVLASHASDFLQELYGIGARRIGILSMPVIGCLPSQRITEGGMERGCSDLENQAAHLFNTKLLSQMDNFRLKFPETRLVYLDIYYTLLDMIQNPAKYGFEVADRGCCGTGNLEASILCSPLSLPSCSNSSSYIFWDSYHPTEEAYQVLCSMVLDDKIKDFF